MRRPSPSLFPLPLSLSPFSRSSMTNTPPTHSEKREEVNKHILKEEEEKAKIQKDLSILTDRLSQINESLARKAQARNEYDKTIQEVSLVYRFVTISCDGSIYFCRIYAVHFSLSLPSPACMLTIL